MTFSYDVSSPTYVERIRYQIGDTDSATAIYSDEEIDFVYDEEGSEVGAAVISLIQNILVKLSHEPDMTADWLKVDWKRSTEHWWKLLAQMKKKYGIGLVASSGGQHAWRPDTSMDEAPTYLDTTTVEDDE